LFVSDLRLSISSLPTVLALGDCSDMFDFSDITIASSPFFNVNTVIYNTITINVYIITIDSQVTKVRYIFTIYIVISFPAVGYIDVFLTCHTVLQIADNIPIKIPEKMIKKV
jgi:hypothetical protein